MEFTFRKYFITVSEVKMRCDLGFRPAYPTHSLVPAVAMRNLLNNDKCEIIRCICFKKSTHVHKV